MNRSGLPCRADLDCTAVFTLTDQDSMDALREAVERRNAHEKDVHQYVHVPSVLPGATPFSQPAAAPKRRGRRRDEELNVV